MPTALDPALPATTAPLAAAQLLQVEELERHSVAGLLHDGPVQGVVAMRFLADLAASALRRGDLEAAAERLAELTVAAREAQADARRTMRGLHGRCLDGLGLAEAIEAHAVAVHADGGPLTRVDVDWPSPLAPVVAITLHRVAQAALADAQSRAATSATVTVDAVDAGISLTVVDDGRDPDPTRTEDSSGLARWAARVPLLGGRLELLTHPGQQQVSCWLPLDHSAIGGARS